MREESGERWNQFISVMCILKTLVLFLVQCEPTGMLKAEGDVV